MQAQSNKTFFRGDEFLPAVVAPKDMEIIQTIGELSADEHRIYDESQTKVATGAGETMKLQDDEGNYDAITAFSAGQLMGYTKYQLIGLGQNSSIDIRWMKNNSNGMAGSAVGWQMFMGLLEYANSQDIPLITTGKLSKTGGQRFIQRLNNTFPGIMNAKHEVDVEKALKMITEKNPRCRQINIRGGSLQ